MPAIRRAGGSRWRNVEWEFGRPTLAASLRRFVASEPPAGFSRGRNPETRMSEGQEITQLLAAVRDGTPGSLDRVFELVYDDLKRRAHYQLAGASPTLNTTALVHEAYVKLVAGSNLEWNDRVHFFRVAARAMRQIVIDRARSHLTHKRGGGAVPANLDDLEVGAASPDTAAETLMALDEALSRLAGQNERLAEVVELRFFGGLSVEEVAETLDVSERTIKRDWRLARAFLQEALTEDGTDQ